MCLLMHDVARAAQRLAHFFGTGKSARAAPHARFDGGNAAGQRGTTIVAWITLAASEIAAGPRYNSMALLADGLHMSSHAAAHDPGLTPSRVKSCLAKHDEVVHSTVELHVCA